MGLETNFQSDVLEYLNSLPGCVAENVSGNSHQSGRPDVNGCFRGRMFKLELKTPDHGYKASKKQELNLRRWKRSGAITGVVYSSYFLKTIFKPAGLPDPGRYEHQIVGGLTSWIDIPEVNNG